MNLDADLLALLPWSTAVAEPDWDALYAQQLPRIYNYFHYRVGRGADIEELTARTFEKAWRSRRRYRGDIAQFTTWLYRIARNVAIDYRRSERRHENIDLATDLPTHGSPEQELALSSDQERLKVLIEGLPDRERELLALKYGAGETNRAIAAVTGLSESNVGTILHRALKTLRAEWE
ncbi:MAG TPA: sigma-70 family RNA polymerase sigma factor [Steroidobacteraceae bacterium]|jgi:RNA polymerase sigma-70 factor (ECF subfamily)